MRPDIRESGYDSFRLTNHDIVTEAFRRIRISPIDVGDDLRTSAMISLNLLFTEFDTNINSWKASIKTITVESGENRYPLTKGFVSAGSVVIRQAGVGVGLGTPIPLSEISEDEYLSSVTRVQDANPQTDPNTFLYRYYIDRTKDGADIVLDGYANQFGDGSLIELVEIVRVQGAGGPQNTPDVPDIWIEAVCAGLAYKLSGKHGDLDDFSRAELADNARMQHRKARSATSSGAPIQFRRRRRRRRIR